MEQFKELAVLVVNAIVRDGAQEAFMNATPAQREEIVIAYAESEVKKFAKVAEEYHCDPEFRQNFIRMVLGK